MKPVDHMPDTQKNTPADRHLFNGQSDVVDFARGVISQTELGKRKGFESKSTYSPKVKGDLAECVKVLSYKYEDLTNSYERLSNDLEHARTTQELASNNLEQLRTELNAYRTDAKRVSSENEQLWTEFERAKCEILELSNELGESKALLERHEGRDGFISFFGNHKAENTMLVMLALFDVAGAFYLLWEMGKYAFAIFGALPLGFALLHFTAKGEVRAKLFAAAFALLVGGFAFEVFDPSHSKYLFAFTPGVLAIIIAFGKRLRGVGK